MKIPALRKTNMMIPTPGERLTSNPAVVFAFCFLVFFLSGTVQSLLLRAFAAILKKHMSYSVALLIQLFCTAALVGGVLLYCLLAEKRSLLSLGIVKRGAVAEYALGLVGGLLMFGGAVLLCFLSGTLSLQISKQPPSVGFLVLFLAGFLIQGMSEELLCRSFLMVSLSRSWSFRSCAILNALFFSILHLGNSNVSVIALVNIFLFGLFASFLTLRRGSIWMVGAVHSMWNFAQGNLFGIPVSGIRGTPSPLSSHLAEGTWQELINGGAFGLEGGLAVTLVLAVSCAIALLMPTKTCEIANSPSASETV